MSTHEHILIFGASARAAAFSALRVGLQPWCADLFADADLRARCPAMRIAPDAYPAGFLDFASTDLPGPWMYTGGLENRLDLVEAMARRRPLWGNDATTLMGARNPMAVARALERAGLHGPAVWYGLYGCPLSRARWLIKPIGAGGTCIRHWEAAWPLHHGSYLQEFIEGPSRSALYCGNGKTARLLGVTEQLVGESWLHAAPFRYCGSIGPLPVRSPFLRVWEDCGNALTKTFEMRGLFGIDTICRGDVPYPVEVNPRYTASVEVLEYATGLSALSSHRQVFQPEAPVVPARPVPASVVGKAILFAREAVTFPADGPWMPTLRCPGHIWDLPAFADIPLAGDKVPPGRPVLTFFARADTAAEVYQRLRGIALDLDAWLYASAR